MNYRIIPLPLQYAYWFIYIRDNTETLWHVYLNYSKLFSHFYHYVVILSCKYSFLLYQLNKHGALASVALMQDLSNCQPQHFLSHHPIMCLQPSLLPSV